MHSQIRLRQLTDNGLYRLLDRQVDVSNPVPRRRHRLRTVLRSIRNSLIGAVPAGYEAEQGVRSRNVDVTPLAQALTRLSPSRSRLNRRRARPLLPTQTLSGDSVLG